MESNHTEKQHAPDTYSYKGWMNSDSFLKRAVSAFGYQAVGSLIIMIPLYVGFFILAAIIAIVAK